MPQNDMGVPQMYSNGHPVKGLSRREAVDYLVKIHVLALRAGVEKIIWYNYRDKGDNATDVEDHFGLRDYWGFPKPVYVAYAVMVNVLEDKRYENTIEIGQTIHAYKFVGVDEDCIIVWAYPPANQTISFLDDLGIHPSRILKILNVVGKPLSIGEKLSISGDPIYILVRKD